jgi:hypothetical protein
MIEELSRIKEGKFWIFQSNAKKYQGLIASCRERDRIEVWTVGQHHMEVFKGNYCFIWAGGLGDNEKMGIYSIGKMISDVFPADINKYKEYRYGYEYPGIGYEVLVQYLYPLKNHISRNFFKNHPILSECSIMRFWQATVFPITQEEGQVILKQVERQGLIDVEQEEFRKNGHKKILNPFVDERDKIIDEIVEREKWFLEGGMTIKTHMAYERNRKAIEEAKNDMLRENKKLFCKICGFSFEDKYGKLGRGIIDIHHIKPVSELINQTKISTSDLIPLCPNCHRIIHSQHPFLSIKDVRNSLKK